MCNPGQELSNAWSGATGLVEGGLKTVGGIGQGIVDTVKTFAKNPLPVIETVALTYMLGPEGMAIAAEADAAIIANAAVAAANGGKMQDIALAAGSAYLGAKAGETVSSTLAKNPELSSVIKQTIISSSSAAATTALAGGNFKEILSSGFNASVGTYVNGALKEKGIITTDSKLISNATSAASSAILKGKSISEAVGASAAATAIRLSITDAVNLINKNDTTASALNKEYTTLYESAKQYFDDNIASVQKSANTNYKAATDAQKEYETAYNKQKAAYDSYLKNKDYYDNYDQKMVAEGYIRLRGGYVKQIDGRWIGAPTKDSFLTAGNADAATVGELSSTVEDAYTKAKNAATTYSKDVDKLASLGKTYKLSYTDKLDAIKTKMDTLNEDQAKLSKTIGENVVKYEKQLETDAGEIAKQIAGEAATTVKNETDARSLGYASYAAQQEDYRVTTKDEAIQFLKDAGVTRAPTSEELSSLMKGTEQGAKELAMQILDVDSVTFDGSKYKTNEEAMLAAQKAGYNTFKTADGQVFTIMSKEQYDGVVDDAKKNKVDNPLADGKIVDINGKELSGLVKADEPYEIVIVAQRPDKATTYEDWLANQEDLKKLGGTSFPKWLSDQLNLVSIVADQYKGTPAGDSAKLVEQALAFGGRNIGTLIKQIAQSTAATGLVDYNNVVAKTSAALERWGNEAQSKDVTGQEKAIINYVDGTKARMAKELGREPTTAELMAGQMKAFISASYDNKLGAASLIAGESLQELPWMLASGGAGKLATQLFGKAAGFAAAIGTDATLNAAESFAGNYTDVYDALRAKGYSDDAAKAKATTSGVEAALVTFGSSVLGDNALVKSFMGEATKLSTGMLAKEATKQYVTEYAEGMLQNASSQYAIDGKIDWSKATAAGAIEGAIGSAVSTGFITANNLNSSGIIGKDAKGNNVTLQEYRDGTKQVATLNSDFNLSKDPANQITIGDAKNYYAEFTKNPDITSTEYFQTVDFFRDSGYGTPTSSEITKLVGGQTDLTGTKLQEAVNNYADPYIIDKQELTDLFKAEGYGEPTAEEIAKYSGKINESTGNAAATKYADSLAVTSQEAKDALIAAGVTSPTAEQIAKFTKVGKESDTLSQIQTYADPLVITADEAKAAFKEQGYTPTDKEISMYTGYKSQSATEAEISKYADPKAVTEAEAKDFFASEGYAPTAEELATYIGNKDETQITKDIAKYADPLATTEQEVRDMFKTVGYEPTDNEVARYVGQKAEDVQLDLAKNYGNTALAVKELTGPLNTRIDDLVKQGQDYQTATKNAIEELSTQNKDLSAAIGTEAKTATQADIDALTNMLSGKQQIDLSYDVNKDNKITQADIDALTGYVGKTNANWDPYIGSHWAPTGLYKTIYDQNVQRTKDLEAQKIKDEEAARKAKLGLGISGVQGAVNAMIPQIQALQAQAQQQQPVEVVEKSKAFDFGQPLDVSFFGSPDDQKSQQEKNALNQQGIVKIASGGSIDDLLSLL